MKARLQHIDGIRGIAASLVVIQHAAETIHHFLPAGLFRAVIQSALIEGVNLGRVGVVMFFLVSGFVVPFSFKGPKPLLSFGIRRFFRLYPAYWVIIAIYCGLELFFYHRHIIVAELLANFAMIQRLLHFRDLLVSFWTLFYEIVFYTICAALFWFGLIKSPVAAFTATISFASFAALPILSEAFGFRLPHKTYFIYLALMFLGSLFRESIIDGNKRALRLLPIAIAAIVVAIPFVSGFAYPVDENNTPSLAPLPQALGFIIGLAAFIASLVTKQPVGPIWLFLGGISYALYLSHPLILPLTAEVFPPATFTSSFLYITTLSISCILASSAMYYGLELPAIRFGHFLALKMAAGRSSASASHTQG